LESGKPSGAILPDQLQLHDEEFALKLFPYMEAFDWRLLPSQILAEDPEILDDQLVLRGRKSIIKELLREERGLYKGK
jgi:hypothetical protein